MENYLQDLQMSMQELAQNPNLPIFIATFAGISVACFAVGFLYMLRKTPLRPETKPAQTTPRGFGKVASSA